MKRRLQAGLGFLVVLALAAAGCTSNSSGDNAGSSRSTSGSSINKNAVFQYAVQNAVNSLDPQLASVGYAAEWYGPAIENLVLEGLSATYKPWLATSWTMGPGYKSMTLQLRHGVKFQDGTLFNAQAVNYDFDRALTLKGSTASALQLILKSINVLGPYEVRLNFPAPEAEVTVLEALANANSGIISPTAAAKPNFGVHPVGTGPYQFVSYNPGVQAVYQRWSGYWGKAPDVARIVITTVTDSTAALNAMLSGQFNMVQIYPNQIAQVKSSSTIHFVELPSPQVNGILLNIDGVFSKIGVRQALSYATNRAAFANFQGGGATPTQQLAHPGSPAFDASLQNLYPYNIAKAKSLLAAAGYPNGLKFTLSFTARPAQQQQAQVLQQMWEKAGFHVTLSSTDGATTVQKCLFQKACDALLGYENYTPDFLSNFLTYGLSYSFSMSTHGDTVVLKAIAAARAAVQPAQRDAAARNANTAAAKQLSYAIPFNYLTYLLAVSNNVQDNFVYNVNQYPYYSTLVMTK